MQQAITWLSGTCGSVGPPGEATSSIRLAAAMESTFITGTRPATISS